MSIDIVDDLQSCEDRAELLRSTARQVVDLFVTASTMSQAEWQQEGFTAEASRAIAELDRLTQKPWCRPSCADGCDEMDCGCLAHAEGEAHHE